MACTLGEIVDELRSGAALFDPNAEIASNGFVVDRDTAGLGAELGEVPESANCEYTASAAQIDKTTTKVTRLLVILISTPYYGRVV
ncbi:MAG: hypothetical protein ABSB96_03570 [Gaiellaceae bacterium]